MFVIRWTLVLCLFSTFASAAVDTLQIGDYVKASSIDKVRLSPNGKYIAMIYGRAAESDKIPTRRLVVLDAETLKVEGSVSLTTPRHVFNYEWVTNNRLVFTEGIVQPETTEVISTGQVFSVLKNGKAPQVIFGLSINQKNPYITTRIRFPPPINSFARIQKPYSNDPPEVMLTAKPFIRQPTNALNQTLVDPAANTYATRGTTFETLYSVNLRSAKRKEIGFTAVGDYDYFFNKDNSLAISYGFDKDDFFQVKKLVKADSRMNSSWKILDGLEKYTHISPVVYREEKNELDLIVSQLDEPNRLISYNLASGNIAVIKDLPANNRDELIVDPYRQTVAIARSDEFEKGYQVISPESEYASSYIGLKEVFKGSKIDIVSMSDDRSVGVAKVTSDVQEGAYYYFNRLTNQLKLITRSRPWLNEKALHKTEAFSFSSFDGLSIQAYLTTPSKSTSSNDGSKQPAPLVVYLQGDPKIDPVDGLFDETVQLLAGQGYAVLQIKYRQPIGAGYMDKQASLQLRDYLLAKDAIVASVKTRRRAEISDKACILGDFYGAFGAVKIATEEAEIFDCIITLNGEYNTELEDATVAVTAIESRLFEYGFDEFVRHKSVNQLLTDFEMPLLFIHGKNNQRAPFENAEKFLNGLEDNDIEYESLVFETEGAVIVRQDHKEEMYQKILSFLDQHLN